MLTAFYTSVQQSSSLPQWPSPGLVTRFHLSAGITIKICQEQGGFFLFFPFFSLPLLSLAGRLRAPCNAQVCFYYSCWWNTISSSAWFHRRRGDGLSPAIFLPIKHSKGKKWVGAIKSQNNAARFYVKRRTDGQIQEGKTSLMTCVQELRLENWQRKAASLPEYKLLCAVKRLLSGVNMGRNTQVRVKSFSPAS